MCGWMKFLYCRKGVRRNHYNTKLEQYKTGNKIEIIERKKVVKEMIWFTSDMHLGHEKALDFTIRPWQQIDEMNEGIIANINAKVKKKDELYILGDYSFRIPALEAAVLRKKIICEKVHLVPGNHDKDWNHKPVQGTFIVEPPIKVLKENGRKFVLSHFPMMDWQSMSHESIHLHGHIHSQGSLYNEMNRMQGVYRYDVGVDANNYTPVSMEEILTWFDGVECHGRVKWKDWVNTTGDENVQRRLAGL